MKENLSDRDKNCTRSNAKFNQKGEHFEALTQSHPKGRAYIPHHISPLIRVFTKSLNPAAVGTFNADCWGPEARCGQV